MTAFLITGANRGIGLELVRQASAGGARVFACTRRPGEATQLKALAKERGGLVEIIELDVADEASIARAAQRLKDEPIGTLINNAGVMGKRQAALEMDGEDFMNTVRVNVLGPVLVTRAFLPNLRLGRSRKVAVISSLMGSFAYDGSAHISYSTSKTAVNRLFQSLARELASEGIRIAILSPGWVRTDMGGPNANLSVEESAQGLLREIAATDAARSGAYRNYAGHSLSW